MSEFFDITNYYFNPYAIPTLFMGTLMGILGIYVFSQNKRAMVNIVFLLLALSVSIWLLGMSMGYLSKDKEQALIWYRYFSFLGVAFIPPNIYFFTVSLLKLFKRQKWVFLATYPIGLLFYLRVNYLMVDVRRYFWGWYPWYSPISYIFLAFFFMIMLVSFWNYVVSLKKIDLPIERNRVKLVFIGLLLAYIGSVDYMPAYGIGVYPFGYIPVCIFGLFLTYAIIKYRLMVITPALAADTIINTMADSLIVFGPERNIIFVNPVTCDLLGYTKEELIGEPADMLFSYGNPFRAQGSEQLIKDGSIYNYEMTYLTKNREMIPVSFNSSAIKDKTGNLVGIVGIARDVRDTKRFIKNLEKTNQELKEAQAQLVQSAKMAAVGQLGAGVAHELNNPLGGILGYAQFILEKFKRPEFSVDDFKNSSRYIESIEREAFRCKGIVENLLKFSRRPISIKPEPLDINQSLHETLSIIGHQLKLKNINLILNLQEDLAKVTGITNQLQQVFTNLILNSQQAMQSGGELKITTQNILDELTKAPTKVRIDFTDTGCGISEENLAHLFEPFFTTKQKDKGTGLGLAVSYQIIQDHKGTLEVTSQVGKGTTLTITLPAILRIG